MRAVPVVLVALLVMSTLSAPAAATAPLLAPPSAIEEPGDADEQPPWREYEPDEEFEIDQSDGLTDEELEQIVHRAMVRIEHLRDVEFEEVPDVELWTREELQEMYDGEGPGYDAELAAFENAKLKALLLLGEDTDVEEARAETMGASVAGFYQPTTNQVVIVSDSDPPQMDEVILAHELYHAFQDQEWGLLQYDERLRDGSAAETGLIEGDTVYVERMYEEMCDPEFGEWECLTAEVDEEGEGSGDLPPNMGLLLPELHPYNDGPAFVDAIYQEGGWEAVNALYDAPPETTQQVISPERYPNETPRNVTIVDTHDEDSWERVRPDGRPDYGVAGKAAIASTFAHPLYDMYADMDPGMQDWILGIDEWYPDDSEFAIRNYGHEYASGWNGDRFHAYQNGEDVASVWRVAWESEEDAQTFFDGYLRVLEYWGGEAHEDYENVYVVEDGGYSGAYYMRQGYLTIKIVHAPTVEELPEIDGNIELLDPDESPNGVDEPWPGIDPGDENGVVQPSDDNGVTEPSDDNGVTDPGDDIGVPEIDDLDGPGQPGLGILAALIALIIGATAALSRR